MRSKLKFQKVILTLITVATLLTTGCVLTSKPLERKIIMVKPGDPVWLVNDIENVDVLARDANGDFKYGKGTLKAGFVVWYDSKWNDSTIRGE